MMICSMMRQILSLIEKIPFAPAVLLAGKVVAGSCLRQPALHISDHEIIAWRNAVRRNGVHVVENFLPEARCALLRAEVDSLMTKRPEAVQVDAHGADHRVFLGLTPPGALGEMYSNIRLAVCAAAFLGADVINLATLAGRLTAVPDNLGSGGGWHRDSFTNQFKAIIYLSDVGKDNGPFQYIRGSHRLSAMIRDRRSAALGVAQSRVGNDEIKKLIEKNADRLITLMGSAGTLILADTTGLHRGMPIAAGTRHALTNYYYAPRTITAARRDHFKPILGVHIPYERTARNSMESL